MGYEHSGDTSPSIELLHKTLGVEYHPTWWGELYYGSEASIGQLGIGGEVPFPEGREEIKCVDPRGLACRIYPSHGGRFAASVTYPGRDTPFRELLQVRADGVQVLRSSYFDEYIGSAEALVAAGLAQEAWLPGPNHVRKSVNYVSPDGLQIFEMPKKSPWEIAGLPGSRQIIRRGKTRYEVLIKVREDERQDRQFRESIRHRKMVEDRPYPILPLSCASRRQLELVTSSDLRDQKREPQEPRRRDHLRLVHSENWIAP